MKEKLYIAYGSNLDQRQMARRCPTADHIVPHRLVDAAVAKEHFLCLGPARKGHDLMPHANSKDRFLANHLLDVVDFNRKVRRVAGAI